MSCLSSRVDRLDETNGNGVKQPQLSAREIEVLLEWLRNDSKLGVGRALHISIGTVGTHLQRIRAKYAAVGRPANTKAALVVRAIQDGLVDIDDL
jgi:DNA-binding CsgD family transcriptional regulator